MHGYFLSLKLYDAARVVANPYVYEEHRAKMVQEKLDKLAEGRIRTRKDQVKVKVNKALAEKIAQEEEREQKREQRKRKKIAEDNTAAMDVDEHEPASKHKTSILSDSRFAALFEDPDFQVDEQSREFALLNPSAAAQKRNRAPEVEGNGWGRGKTAVEEEDEESDRMSSGDQRESTSESLSPSGEDESEEDSSDAGGTYCHFLHVVTDFNHNDSDLVLSQKPSSSSRRSTNSSMRLVPLQAQAPSTASDRVASRDASFGHRRSATTRHRPKETENHPDAEHIFRKSDGSVGVSWVPAPRSKSEARAEQDEDMGRGGKPRKAPKGVERFGAGMEKGGGDRNARELSEQERSGRKQRRWGMRSGSKNALRNA
jgi:ribosome biogenesis protein ENP2